MKRAWATLVWIFTFFAIIDFAHAEGAKPRFVIILDNSGSMTSVLGSGTSTHGDGSETHPGCDIDNNGKYDDSRIFQAKAALIDTIAAFGSAEFALASYRRTLLGQPCTSSTQCQAIVAGSSCVDLPEIPGNQRFCVAAAGSDYKECGGGNNGCVRCANANDTNDRIFENTPINCNQGATCLRKDGCIGGQVIVGFPSSGSNANEIYRWIDGKEDLPGTTGFAANANREMRASTWTPIAASVESIRDWLVDSSMSAIGANPGLLSETAGVRDPKAGCRSYNVILLTDGAETCGGNPKQAAIDTYHRCTNGGAWSVTNSRCEIAGSPTGTVELFPRIKVYVIGFTTGSSTVLNDMAVAGGTGKAYYPLNRGELTAALGDIILSSIPTPTCDCDGTCDDEDSVFTLKGKPCSVGVGRCKREGVYACNPGGDGVECSVGPVATCPATKLNPGTGVEEICGIAQGCQAPTPDDCSDDDCDGMVDEGLTCTCASQPELCNGIDDNCNSVVDDVVQVPCGSSIGECKAGTTACVLNAAGVKETQCTGATGPTKEICDGKDNDCDGVVDGIYQDCYPTGQSGCAVDPATGLWACKGVCRTGRQQCTGGAWGTCVAAKVPGVEIACDGLDNNCDGIVDENSPGTADRCYPPGIAGCDLVARTCVGECKLGTPVCQSPGQGPGIVCTGATTPLVELCNGKDDNCNGKIDEDFPDLGKKCGTGSCQNGTMVCNSQGTNVICSVNVSGGDIEICDGIDNDCDGAIDEAPGPGEAPMPGVGLPCGSTIGQCKPGITACVNGKIVCNDVRPQSEVCNGVDDNCDGSVDEGLTPPSIACNPAGLPLTTPLQGECRPGVPFCDGAKGWQCQGGVGPKTETCDCKDNDCNGAIDDGDLCGAGKSCVDCECVPRCMLDEVSMPCPPDRFCKAGVCVIKECAIHPCAKGETCTREGKCVDLCVGVQCPSGSACEEGVCRDCYTKGCPTGSVCLDRMCVPDPCFGVMCPVATSCKSGACVGSCADVSCPSGTRCKDGGCVPDACAGKTCDIGLFCDPASGECILQGCASIQCPVGYVCSATRATCIPNPCSLVHCEDGLTCSVAVDDAAECLRPTSAVPQGIPYVASGKGGGGAGCGCRVGGTSPRSSRWLPIVGMAALLWARRRR